MPTIRQRLVFSNLIKALERGENIDLKVLMLKSGYSPNTETKDLTKSKGWKELLAQISDEVILARLYQILLDKDKRAALEAADMLLKLKDRYPKNKLALEVFREELSKVAEEEKALEEPTVEENIIEEVQLDENQ